MRISEKQKGFFYMNRSEVSEQPARRKQHRSLLWIGVLAGVVLLGLFLFWVIGTKEMRANRLLDALNSEFGTSFAGEVTESYSGLRGPHGGNARFIRINTEITPSSEEGWIRKDKAAAEAFIAKAEEELTGSAQPERFEEALAGIEIPEHSFALHRSVSIQNYDLYALYDPEKGELIIISSGSP